MRTKSVEDTAAELSSQLAAAEATLQARGQEVDECAQAVKDIEAEWASGDDSTSADDYEGAKAVLTRAQALLEGARVQVSRLRRQQINLDLRVADALVRVVEQGLKGRVPVEVRAGRQVPLEGDVPRVVLTQQEPTIDVGGIVRGEVELYYLRDDLHSPFPVAELESAAEANGFTIQVTRQQFGRVESRNGLSRDDLLIKVARAFAHTPTIEETPDDEVAKEWGSSLAKGLAYRVARNDEPVRYFSEATPDSTGYCRTAKVTSCSVVDNIRTTVVEAEISVRPHLRDLDPGRILTQELERQIGLSHRGLGRMTELSHRMGSHGTSERAQWVDVRVIRLTSTFEAIAE